MRRRSSTSAAGARALAVSLPVPTPFTVRGVLLNVERSTGRPITLHPVPPGWAGTAGWCGAWLPAPDRDHIVFVRDPTSTVRNAGTILHEVGHMLLGHEGQPLPPDIDLPSVGIGSLDRARGRSGFDDPDEQAAEVFASVILQRGLASRGAVEFADARTALLKNRLS